MRFPRYHLAESTVRRILNVASDISTRHLPTPPPAIPDATKQGQALDVAIAAPTQQVPAPEGVEADVALENMSGGSAADAITSTSIMDALQ